MDSSLAPAASFKLGVRDNGQGGPITVLVFCSRWHCHSFVRSGGAEASGVIRLIRTFLQNNIPQAGLLISARLANTLALATLSAWSLSLSLSLYLSISLSLSLSLGLCSVSWSLLSLSLYLSISLYLLVSALTLSLYISALLVFV